MNHSPALTEFETHRRRLFGLAYRMLGSATDAEDVLQDAYLRWNGVAETAREPAAYLTTIVTRLCLDSLTTARARRETYVGPWLPEPIAAEPEALGVEGRAELNDTLSLAFLAVLERLTPLERAVFLLRNVFGYDYAEIAGFVGRSEPACRKVVSRARRFVRANRPRLPASAEAHRAILNMFLGAMATGDTAGLLALLHEDVIVIGDGGGKAYAAPEPIAGVELVARFLAGLRRSMPTGYLAGVERINGWEALVVRSPEGRPYAVLTIESDGHRVHAVRSVINPDKLRALVPPT